MEAYHLPVLIRDLAIILMTAGITSLLCRWLKQPVILGYVLAGIIVGPKVSFTATVNDIESVKVWGEIGVIFVLFSLGLEFSFRRLLRVGGPAALTAGIETSLLLGIGTAAGLALGWPKMDSIFLGGMLCISSTMIIVKIFEELNLKGKHFSHFVLGILIVEDLVAVLLLVLLSTIAVTQELSGGELAVAAARLGFFLILWFAVGLFVLPGLIRFLRKYLNPETALIFCSGLCLLMVLIATGAGFSPALGAFVMGSLLAETEEGPRVEHVLHSLRTFFGAIFFVSVGILFDPHVFLDLWPVVLVVTLILILGKSLAVGLGATVAGQPFKTAVYSGLAMTQIGEFSFIIANLGLQLKVVSEKLFPVAVGVSLLSSMLTPVWLKRGPWVMGLAERFLPQKLKAAADHYRANVQSHQGDKIVPALIRFYAPTVLVNLVLLVATTSLVRALIYPRLVELLGPGASIRVLGLVLDLTLCLPFFYGMAIRRPGKKWRQRAVNFPRIRWVELAINAARIVLALFVFLLIVAQYTGWRTWSGVTLAVLLIAGALLYRFGEGIYRRLESRFLGQIAKDEMEAPPPLLPWDTHLEEVVVAADSPVCGMTLEKFGADGSFNVMIAAIDRGHRRILAPRATEQLFPQDRLRVIGDDLGIERMRQLVESGEDLDGGDRPLSLESVVLEPDSGLCGVTVRESRIREKVEGLLVGIEREGLRQLNPSADLRLEAGDRLWIVGDPDRIASLNS